eukprot:g11104.t1
MEESSPLLPESGIAKTSRISYHSVKRSSRVQNRRSGSGYQSGGGSSTSSGAGFGRSTSWWESVFSIVTTAIGAGIVTLPSVFQSTGWMPATLILFSCTGISIVAALKKAQVMERIEDLNEDDEDMSQMSSLTKVLFGKCWAAVYSKFYHTFIVLVGCVFMLLLAMNFTVLFDYTPFFTVNGWIVIVAVILTLLCWLRDVSVLARISFVAWLSCIVVIVIVAINTALTPMRTGDEAMTYLEPPQFSSTTSLVRTFPDRSSFVFGSVDGEINASPAPGAGEHPGIASALKLDLSANSLAPKFLLTMTPQPFDASEEYLAFPKWARFRSCQYAKSCLIGETGELLYENAVAAVGDSETEDLAGFSATATEDPGFEFPGEEQLPLSAVRVEQVAGPGVWAEISQRRTANMRQFLLETGRREADFELTKLDEQHQHAPLQGAGSSGASPVSPGGDSASRNGYFYESVDANREKTGDAVCELTWETVRKNDPKRGARHAFLETLRLLRSSDRDASDLDAEQCEALSNLVGDEFKEALSRPPYSHLTMSHRFEFATFNDRNKMSLHPAAAWRRRSDSKLQTAQLEAACAAAPQTCRTQPGKAGCWLSLSVGQHPGSESTQYPQNQLRGLFYQAYPLRIERNPRAGAAPGRAAETAAAGDEQARQYFPRAAEVCAAASGKDASPEAIAGALQVAHTIGITDAQQDADLVQLSSWSLVEKVYPTLPVNKDVVDVLRRIADTRPSGKLDIRKSLSASGVHEVAGGSCLVNLEEEQEAVPPPGEEVDAVHANRNGAAAPGKPEKHGTYALLYRKNKENFSSCAELWKRVAAAVLNTAGGGRGGPADEDVSSELASIRRVESGSTFSSTTDLLFQGARSEQKTGWQSLVAALSWIVEPTNKVFFSFTFVMMIPALYTSMVEPERIQSSIYVSSLTVATIYFVVGFCGYLTYGKTIRSSIVDSMRNGFVNPYNHKPAASWMGIVVAAMIVVNVFISFALIMNSTLLHIEMKLTKNARPEDVRPGASKLVRTAVVWLAGIFVWSVPFFAQLVSLVAAFGCVLTQVPYPLLAYGVVYKHERSCAERAFHVLLLIFSAISIVYGAGEAIVDLGTSGVYAMRERLGLVEVPVFQPLPTGPYKTWGFLLNYNCSLTIWSGHIQPLPTGPYQTWGFLLDYKYFQS